VLLVLGVMIIQAFIGFVVGFGNTDTSIGTVPKSDCDLDWLIDYWYPCMLVTHTVVVATVFAVTGLLCARLRTGLAISARSRHRVTRQLLTYAIGFSAADLASLIIYSRETFDAAALFILSCRGLWDMLVWGTANLLFKPPASLVKLSVAYPMRDIELGDMLQPDRQPDVDLSPLPNGDRNHHFSADPAGADAVAKEAPQSPPKRMSFTRRAQKLDVAEELRYELVLLTAHGIAKCTTGSWLRATTSCTTPQLSSDKSVTSSLSSLLGSIKESLQWGSRKERTGGAAALGAVVEDPRGCSSAASSLSHSVKGSFSGISDPRRSSFGGATFIGGMSRTGGLHPKITVPGLNKREIDFFDYGTEEFGKVRAAIGYSGRAADEYARAFRQVEQLMSEYSHKDKREGFREIISSGASGSYFYVTPNRQFIVKTISKAEKATLMSVASEYVRHCERNPGTMIQYLGCHSIRLPLNTAKIYFVVMTNALPAKKLDSTFDLKGATANRQRVRGADKKAMLSGARSLGSFKTLLDHDWMALGVRHTEAAIGMPWSDAAG